MRLCAYFTKYKPLYKDQKSFRNLFSTDLALATVVKHIPHAWESKQVTLAILTDFSKAFNMLNHTNLTKSLEFYGIRGLVLSWVKSYLNLCKQRTKIGIMLLLPLTAECVVPEGSILELLSFIIYMNDITEHVVSSKLVLFADDCTCLVSAGSAAAAHS